MTDPVVRKIQLEISRDHIAGLSSPGAGHPLERPHRSGSIAAVVANPFAGTVPNEEALGAWMSSLETLATELSVELREALTADTERAGYSIESYGKGAIVGVGGEMEIAAAWHVPAGIGLRESLGGPKAQVPSSKKVGALGSQLDIPLVYLHASYARSHYDAHAVVVPDGPRPDEVVYALVMSTGQRPNHRIGGFSIDEAAGDDGQR